MLYREGGGEEVSGVGGYIGRQKRKGGREGGRRGGREGGEEEGGEEE